MTGASTPKRAKSYHSSTLPTTPAAMTRRRMARVSTGASTTVNDHPQRAKVPHSWNEDRSSNLALKIRHRIAQHAEHRLAALLFPSLVPGRHAGVQGLQGRACAPGRDDAGAPDLFARVFTRAQALVQALARTAAGDQ